MLTSSSNGLSNRHARIQNYVSSCLQTYMSSCDTLACWQELTVENQPYIYSTSTCGNIYITDYTYALIYTSCVSLKKLSPLLLLILSGAVLNGVTYTMHAGVSQPLAVISANDYFARMLVQKAKVLLKAHGHKGPYIDETQSD